MAGLYRYFVEGECEKKLLHDFMYLDDHKGFIEGKIEVLNFINQRISKSFARTIKRNTTVVIVIDTDVRNISNLEYNIQLLKDVALLDDDHILIVLSVSTFEDEIVYSTNISNIHQLLSTKGKDEFKKKFISHKDLLSKLTSVNFSIDKIWSRHANDPFDKYPNDGNRVKK